MGIPSLTFLCATQLLAAWLVLPFLYHRRGSERASSRATWRSVQQIGEVSSGGYLLIFWMFQNPPDLLFSGDQGDGDGDRDRRWWAATTATPPSGGPVGVGTATAKSMVLYRWCSCTSIGMLMGSQLFWGANRRAPIGG